MLQGVTLRHHAFSLGGALGSLLAAAGRDLPQPYIMGATGLAFRTTLDLVLSPGGPMEINFHEQMPLWEHLGAWFKRVAARPAEEHFPATREEVLVRLKESVDRGRPAIAFDLLALPEYGLVVGYEEDRLTCLTLHNPAEPAEMPASTWPPEAHAQYTRAEAITLLDLAPDFDRRRAEVASLRFAVEHFWSPPSRDNWIQHGLKAYEFWLAVLGSPLPMHGTNPALGQSYNLMVLHALRRDAATYLEELAVRYPEAPPLQAAAKRYGEVVSHLEAATAMLPFPGDAAVLTDGAAKRRLADSLRLAMAAERQGIDEIERAIRSLR